MALDLKILLPWISFIVLLAISSIFTHSISLTLDEVIFHLASFCIFMFFLSLGESRIFSKSDFISTFLIIGIVFSIFFIVFFSFSNLTFFLPPLNIFTAVNGHSHMAAVLLILIPLSWIFASSNKYSNFSHRYLLVVLFYILLVLNFGRFSILLALIQLPFLYLSISKKVINKKYFLMAIFLLVFSIISIGYFSFDDRKTCKVREFDLQLCKPLVHEARPDYFRRAILGIKDFPFFGYGPGTYRLLSAKYNFDNKNLSTFAHNVFLEMYAGSGIFVGTAYLVLIFILFKLMFSVRENGYNTIILIGLMGLLLNSFMDYDWNGFPIYQMSMIFISLVLWDYQQKKSYSSKISSKLIWNLLTILIIILGLVNLTTKLLINFDRDEDAFNFFPHFYFHSNYFLTESNITNDQKKKLYELNPYDEKYVYQNISESTDPQEKSLLYGRLLDISPLISINSSYFDNLKQINDYEMLASVATKGFNLLNQAEVNSYLQKDRLKSEILSVIHEGSISLIESGNLDSAINYYDTILEVVFNVSLENNFHVFYSEYYSLWSSNLNTFFDKLYKKDPEKVRFELQKIYSYDANSKKRDGEVTVFAYDILSAYAVKLAKSDLESGRFSDSAKMLVIAQSFNKWVLNELPDDFFDLLNADVENEKIFWLAMDEFPDEYFVKFSGLAYEKNTILLLEESDYDAFKKRLERILKIAHWIENTQEYKDLSEKFLQDN
ncbi:O-antigen ligase family protein [Candidatus Woesebacteria bacterium]|nr:O-antigen ligase family protein [Candidatus Woesebacteria bacterium]